MVGWTCCGIQNHEQLYLPVPMGTIAIMKDDRLNKNKPGCQKAELHVEDVNFTNCLRYNINFFFPNNNSSFYQNRHFPYDPTNEINDNQIQEPSAPTLQEIEEPKDDKKYHHIKPGDTLGKTNKSNNNFIILKKKKNSWYCFEIQCINQLLEDAEQSLF